MNQPLDSYIPLVLRGDRAATVEFSKALIRFAWGHLQHWRLPATTKEDLAVTCSTTVILKLRTCGKGSFEAWVKVILHRLACDAYNELKEHSLDSMDDDCYVPGSEVDLFCASDYPEAAQALLAALALLSDADALILAERYCDSPLEFQEIAQLLGMKTNSVMKRRERALEALHKMLQDHPDIQVWQSRQTILVPV